MRPAKRPTPHPKSSTRRRVAAQGPTCSHWMRSIRPFLSPERSPGSMTDCQALPCLARSFQSTSAIAPPARKLPEEGVDYPGAGVPGASAPGRAARRSVPSPVSPLSPLSPARAASARQATDSRRSVG